MPPFDNTPGSPDGPPADDAGIAFEDVFQVDPEPDGFMTKLGALFGVIFIALVCGLLASGMLWLILWFWANLPGRPC